MNKAQELKEITTWLYLKAHETKSGDAALRRAVSTAYYAVFRLIIDDGIDLLFNNNQHNEDVRRIFSRQFNHSSMLNTFKKLNGDTAVDKSSKFYNSDLVCALQPKKDGKGNVVTSKLGTVLYEPVRPLPEIVLLANNFIMLQEYRHLADYDMYYPFSIRHVQPVIKWMDDFFDTWLKLRNDDLKIINTLCYHLLYPDMIIRE